MANIEVFRIEFESPQAADSGFPINVVVENHEIVTPFSGPEACKTEGVAGHKVNVTLTIEREDGRTVYTENQFVCAPVQVLMSPNARARFDVDLPAGTYFVRAEVEAVEVDGYDSSEPYRLEVEADDSAVREGGLTGGSESTAATGFTDFSGVDGGDLPFGAGDAGGLLSNPWVLGGLALLVLIGLRPYTNLAARGAD